MNVYRYLDKKLAYEELSNCGTNVKSVNEDEMEGFRCGEFRPTTDKCISI